MKKKMKSMISILLVAITLFACIGTSQKIYAASNPYPTTQDWDGDGYYEIPCTRFAWQQVYDNLGIALPAWGNAGTWYQSAINAGIPVGSVAKPGSVAVWSNHVAYVVSASGNTFVVNEGGRTDLDQTDSHGVKYGYQLTNAVGAPRPYDSGNILLGFIYPAGTGQTITPATLSCTVGNSASATKFSWNGGTDCEFYTLRIFRKVNGTYTDTNSVWNLKTRSHNVVLPAGDYRAYVDCVIGSNYNASNEVYFTVEKWKEWEYSKNSDGTITLKKYRGNATEVVIPATYDGYRVSCVGYTGNGTELVGAFQDNTTIKKVVISEGITKLQKQAFSGCKNLESVTLPNSLEELGGSAFGDCKSLKSIILPEKLKLIGTGAFSNSGIVSIVLPEGITEIGVNTFRNADSLQSVTVLGELTHIGSYAFEGCDNLLTISFAKRVKSIGNQAFSNCKNLKSILIPSGVEIIGKWAFLNCEKLKSVTVFGNVEQIEADAFAGCPKDMIMSSTADSALRDYAKTNQISYEVITAVKGDADGDGKVSVNDALTILMHIAGKNPKNYFEKVADCDGTAGVTVSDALAILMHIAGKKTLGS